MAVTSSGQIDLNQINVEAGGTSGGTCSINDSHIRALIGKASGAQSAFSEFYGASAFDIDFPNVSVSKQSGVYTETITATVSGSGTLRFTMGGGTGSGSIRVKAGAGGTYTAYASSGVTRTLAVSDGQTIYLQWNHGAEAHGSCDVRNHSTAGLLDTISLDSSEIVL